MTREGLRQIETRRYAQELEDAGVKTRSEIAVAFCGKKLRILGREITST